jgi:hypothetical protein
MDVISVMMAVENDPTLLAKCPRLRYLLEKLRRLEREQLEAALQREWERRYGVPQLPKP